MNTKNDIRRIKTTMGLINEDKTEEKVVMYLYICDKEDPKYEEFLDRLNDIDIGFIGETSRAHHKGLSRQGILDTNNMEDAVDVAKVIYDTFDENPLIVLTKTNIKTSKRIGHQTTKELIKSGEIFDELVKNKKKGIYIV